MRLVLQALLAASAMAIGACLLWSLFRAVRSAGARAAGDTFSPKTRVPSLRRAKAFVTEIDKSLSISAGSQPRAGVPHPLSQPR